MAGAGYSAIHQTRYWRGYWTVSWWVARLEERNELHAHLTALIGLTYSAGIGAVTGSTDTPVTLAGCPAEDLADGVCPGSSKMRSPTLWVGIMGGVVTCFLMMYRVKGAIIAGILLVAIISWPRPTDITYFPYTAKGQDSFDFFRKVVTFHPIEKTLNVLEWDLSNSTGQFGLALITFLYVDILDATGTLYSMARFCGAVNEETQDFEGSAIAYIVDALGISIGSLFGLSPVTAFVESGAGISEGGATGLTAIVTAICFFISVFFAPIFASIPPWATGCTLVLVGSMMCKVAKDINWSYAGDAVPAFITLAVMPFTYSIAYGLIAGIFTYIALNFTVWVLEVLSKGRIVPHNKHLKDPWTWKVRGGILPGWLKRLLRGLDSFLIFLSDSLANELRRKKDFWREDPETLDDVRKGTISSGEKTLTGTGAGETVIDIKAESN